MNGILRYLMLFNAASIAQYDQLIGGVASGIASTAVCHPLDLLKTRFSANEGNPLRPQYSSYWDAASRIARAEGFRGLYQGFSSNLTGAALAWGLYFHWYHQIKPLLPKTERWENTQNFATGIIAGTAVMAVTNPIWVTKTRLFLQYETSGPKKYSGMVDCFRKVFREEGIRGLYKGFVIGIAGTTHGAIQFMVYLWLKKWRCRAKNMPNDSPLTNVETIYCSAISKIIATTAIFPYQVLRTRVQDHNVRNSGIIETTRRLLQGEGVRGLYKGCLMANVRLLPAAVVTFVTYENIRHGIRNLAA